MSRILIVEDEPRISSFIEKGLRAEGYTPTVAADGITALDYALSGQFDLAILDIGLPGMDGFEVLRRMRESGSGIPVIVLTTSRAEEDVWRSYKLHANAYIPKPVSIGEFVEVIRSLGNFWFNVAALPSGPR